MNTEITRCRNLIVTLAAITTFAGCANVLPSRTSADMYVLRSRTEMPQGMTRLTDPLAVSQPIASGIHLTEQIPILVGPNKIETLADARMIISLPAMVQIVLTDAFINSGGVPVVESDPALLLRGYHLRTYIRDFGADASSGDITRVVLDIGASLVRLPSMEIVAAKEFGAEKTPQDPSGAGIVAALDAAMYDLQGEIVEWTLATGAADEASR